MCLTIEKIPVVDAIFYITIILQDFSEKFTKEVIIGGLLKPKLAHVVQVDPELLCKPKPKPSANHLVCLSTPETKTIATYPGTLHIAP